jgi:hypothetical protein
MAGVSEPAAMLAAGVGPEGLFSENVNYKGAEG